MCRDDCYKQIEGVVKFTKFSAAPERRASSIEPLERRNSREDALEIRKLGNSLKQAF
jgi:hypothetical protein